MPASAMGWAMALGCRWGPVWAQGLDLVKGMAWVRAWANGWGHALERALGPALGPMWGPVWARASVHALEPM